MSLFLANFSGCDLNLRRSEEDNDPLTDDAASIISVPIQRSNRNTNPPSAGHLSKSPRKHQLASDLPSDDGVDSPTYDGDIESSTTAGPDSHKALLAPSHHYRHSSGSTLTSPISAVFPQTTTVQPQSQGPTSPRIASFASPPIFISQPSNPSPATRVVIDEPTPTAASQAAFNPASLTPDDIRTFVQKAIEGESWRKYKINDPPTDRQVRVYADGLLDALLLPLPLALLFMFQGFTISFISGELAAE